MLNIRDANGNFIKIPVIKGDKGDQGPKGDTGNSGIYIGQEAPTDPNQVVWLNPEGVLNIDISDYWLEHLEDKINDIKTLQDKGGKDCFSFVVLADMHWGSNLGKKSPQLAKYIMDKCGIKKCLILGDTQSRGAWSTKEKAEAEFDETAEAFEAINGKLRTQGNHDGSWGTLDGKSYAYNFTPNELYNRIYRNVYAENPNAKTDSSGTAYYVDDDTDKVRYIMLNTHCNAYSENDDGSVMYNNMKVFRFTQSQYDFLCNDALATVPEGYSVIVGAHAPISNMYADLFGGTDGEAKTMRGLLTAYKNKTAYSREWAGTANGGAAYTNLADSSSGDWLTGYRINSSKQIVKVENAPDLKMTNYFDVSNKSVLHVKGLNVVDALFGTQNYNRVIFYDENKEIINVYQLTSYTEKGFYSTADYDSDVTILDLNAIYDYFLSISMRERTKYVRLGGIRTVSDDSDIIITADENIAEAEHGYDYINVNADFTQSKGELVGYFSGHTHADYVYSKNDWGVNIITHRCDAKEENDSTVSAERVEGTTTEQSFDVVTVNTATKTIFLTKIGAGEDRNVKY